MAFLQKSDYASQIKQDLLEIVVNQDDSIRTRAELAAQAEIESYLRSRYDVVQIFTVPVVTPEPTDEMPEPVAVPDYTQRHPQILMYMIDVTLYHLHSRINPRNISEIREVRYNQAIDWLKAVAKGHIAPDLPALTIDQPSNRTTWGSWPKQQNFF